MRINKSFIALTSSDASVAWSNITGTPTTLSGYGITDGVPTSRTLTINGTTFYLSANRTWSVGTVTSVGLSSSTSGVTIGSTPITSSGTITLDIATASGSQNGLLSSTDWTTFNNKQNALTNPVTGTGTTNYIPKWTSGSALGNSSIFDNGSEVGIGTTSPGAALHIFRSAYTGNQFRTYAELSTAPTTLSYTTSDGFGLILNMYEAVSGNPYTRYADIVANTGDISDSAMRFFTKPYSGNATERMRITSGGNVGIGTASPSAFAGGGLTLGDNTSGKNLILYSSSAGNNGLIEFIDTSASNALQIGATTSVAYLYGYGSRDMGFSTNGLERMRISSGGNLLVGTTTDSGYKLDVNGTGLFRTSLLVSSTTNASLSASTNSTTGYSYIDLINTGTSGKNFQIGIGGNATSSVYANNLYFDLVGVGNLMTLTSGGNLGLGVTPSAWDTVTPILQIGTASFYGYQTQARMSANYFYQTTDKYNQNGFATSYLQATGQHIWYTAPNNTSGAGAALTFAQAMTLTNGGNLLVGTTVDSGERLQVLGSARITGSTDGAQLYIFNTNASFNANIRLYGSNQTTYFLDIASGNSKHWIYGSGAVPMVFGTNGTERMSIASAGAVTINNLAGTGTRMVVADANGLLSTQAISGGGSVTSVGLTSSTTGVTITGSPVTSSGNLNFEIATASGSTTGLLSSTDWNTFNNKQNALTNPVTGTGTSGQISYFNGTTSITSESNLFWDATNDRLGVGTNNPQRKITVFSSTQDDHILISGTAPSVAMTDTVTGATYQAKFGLATASNQFATGSVAGDFVISNQTGAIIWALNSVQKMQLKSTSQLQLHAYTSTSSFTGTAAGVLAFDSSGNILTIATPTGTVTSVALATGTTGTDVNVSGSPITGSGTITLNIPDAGASARGLMTTGTQTIAGQKTFSGGIVETRIDPRSITTTSTSTLTPNVSTDDFFTVTAQAATITLANPTGTPVDGQRIIVRIKDNGTSRTIQYGTEYRGSTDLPLPTATTISKTLYLGFIYNSADTKWDLIAELDNF